MPDYTHFRNVDVEAFAIDGEAVSVSAGDLTYGVGSMPAWATYTIGVEAGNVIKVTVQLKTGDMTNLTFQSGCFAWLSDGVATPDLVAAAPDGGWAIAASGILVPVVAGKAAMLITGAAGLVDVNITHAAGAKTMYMGVLMPTGAVFRSNAITFA